MPRLSGRAPLRPREPPAGAATAAELLHAQGWVRLERPPLAVDASTLEAIRAAEYQPIFNGQPADEAPLRHMGRSREWATAFEATFTDALRDAGLLVCADGVREKVVCDCYALRSLGLGAAAHDPARATTSRRASTASLRTRTRRSRRAPTRRGRCPTPTCRCRRCSA